MRVLFSFLGLALAVPALANSDVKLTEDFNGSTFRDSSIKFVEMTSDGKRAAEPGLVATVEAGQLKLAGYRNDTGRLAVEGFDYADVTITMIVEFENQKAEVVYEGDKADQPRNSVGLILRAPHEINFGNGTSENPGAGMVAVEFLNNGGLLVRERNQHGRLQFLSSKTVNPLTGGPLYAYQRGGLGESYNGQPFDLDNDGVLERGEQFKLTVILSGQSIAVCINDDPIYTGPLGFARGESTNSISLLKGRPGKFSNASTIWIDHLDISSSASIPDSARHTDGVFESPNLSIESVDMIWDRGPHQAFTDLIYYKDRWVCAFREADKHDGGIKSSKIVVLTSQDAVHWELVHEYADPRGDVRDAKLSVNPEGELVLLTAMQLFGATSVDDRKYQTVALITTDPQHWLTSVDVLDDGYWLWGLSWNPKDGYGYSIGYRADYTAHLYRTRDGRSFERVVHSIDTVTHKPNESAILFDGSYAYCLLRAFGPAYIGIASEPFTDWQWKRFDQPVGGPELLQLPNGTLLGAGRLYLPGKVRTTSIFQIDPHHGSIRELLRLPSGGDTSYPGMVYRDGKIYMSYYSSHEGKSKIYFAKVAVDAE